MDLLLLHFKSKVYNLSVNNSSLGTIKLLKMTPLQNSLHFKANLHLTKNGDSLEIKGITYLCEGAKINIYAALLRNLNFVTYMYLRTF